MNEHHGISILSPYSFLMDFSHINYLGVVIAVIISFISGGIWFGPKTFYPVWMKARGIASGQLSVSQNKPTLLFGGTFIAIVAQVMTLAAILSSLQGDGRELSVRNGALIGLLLGFGIGAAASLSHRLFGGESVKVWVIETSNDVINLTIAGALLTLI